MGSFSVLRASGPAIVAVLALAAPGPALAATIGFTIDPVLSTFTIGPSSEVRIDTGVTVIPMPVGPSPFGVGAVLPDGTTSDGLTTFANGIVTADLNGTLEILGAGTLIDAGVSGQWAPSASGPMDQTDADLAALFENTGFGISGIAALRSLFFSMSSSVLSLTETSPGVFETPSAVDFRVLAGEIQVFSDFGIDTGTDLFNITPPNNAGPMVVELLAGNQVRITIPVDALVQLDADDFLAGAPLEVDVQITGQIVALGTIPEPGTGTLLAGGIFLLALARRRGVVNGMDDDCDGNVDEPICVKPPDDDFGLCASGSTICSPDDGPNDCTCADCECLLPAWDEDFGACEVTPACDPANLDFDLDDQQLWLDCDGFGRDTCGTDPVTANNRCQVIGKPGSLCADASHCDANSNFAFICQSNSTDWGKPCSTNFDCAGVMTCTGPTQIMNPAFPATCEAP